MLKEQRVVIVSGGAGGVGLTVSQQFAAQGDMVYVIDRPEAQQRISDMQNEHIRFAAADVLDESSVEQALADIYQHVQRIDVLVNIVGGYAAGQPIETLDLATWSFMLDLNVKSAFLLSKHVVPYMKKRSWGRIINFSSRAARDLAANSGAYAVSKAAVIALSEVQAKEVLAAHITVNAILPSIVDTPANRAAMPHADFSRWPKAGEIAQVVLFLASEGAGLISGASIPVYGHG